MTSGAGRLGTGATGDPMRSGSGQVSHGWRAQYGFAYVLLLMAVAVLALGASAALQLGAQAGRRDAEQALLSTGAEFERALYSYAGVAVAAANTSGALAARGPRALEELLKDPRVPGVRRHLRQLYADPMTGRQEWGVVRDPAGFIIGVYSQAQGQPIKRLGFDARHAHFEEAPSYAKWVFGLPMAQLQAMRGAGQPVTPAAAKP